MSTWDQLGAPFTEAMLLVAIHTYLGLHILRRGVVFVDLALAQVAALGGLCAFLAGLPPGSLGATGFTLVFALLGAALLAILRPRIGSRVPQEALIGLVYAFASALALLVMTKAPEGAEHLRETLTGTLLWVSWDVVGHGALIFAGVGLVHWAARKPLRRISDDPAGAAAAGIRVGLWDFFFYATFAVVVTHAVTVAGVLLVFVFLVAPATLAMLWFARFGAQLLFGWLLGLLVCVGGLAASLQLDLPASPTVIGVYAGVLALAGAARWLGDTEGGRLRRAGVLGVLVAAVGALFGLARLGEAPHPHAEAPTTPAFPAAHASPSRDLLAALAAADLPEEKEARCASRGPDLLRETLARAEDPFDRLALARCLAPSDPKAAAMALHQLAADPAAPGWVRVEAAAPP